MLHGLIPHAKSVIDSDDHVQLCEERVEVKGRSGASKTQKKPELQKIEFGVERVGRLNNRIDRDLDQKL